MAFFVVDSLILHQCIVFVLTFWAYVSLHTSRQAFSNAKQDLIDDWGFTKYPLEGTMDAIFLFTYAIGLYISGYVGDMFDAKKVLSFGLLMTGVVIFIFGASVPWFHLHHDWYFMTIWAINGFVQSTGWPTSVKIMGKWFGENHAGFIFGIWSANASVGNIVGAAMVDFVHSNGYSDEWVFWLPAFQLALTSILIALLIRTQPSDWGIDVDHDDGQMHRDVMHSNHSDDPSMWNVKGPLSQQDSMGPAVDRYSRDEPLLTDPIRSDDAPPIPIQSEAQSISFCQALRLPNVITYALCYAFLKSVNYTMFFWLPYFLDGVFSEEVSDNMSIVYNVGQILGGWVCGWISDFLRRRAPPVFLFLLIAIPPIFLLRIKSTSEWYFGILSFLAGFFIGGPANMISSAISADLGKHKSLMGNTAALATVAGIIDGTGSTGAAITQYLVALISNVSWDLVFAVLAVLLFSSAALLLRLTIKETRSLIKYGRKDSAEIEAQHGRYAVQQRDSHHR